MQCVEFEERLNAVLDDRRRPEWDAELRQHCEACIECRQLAVLYGALFDGFYAAAAPEAPADMAARVMAQLQPRPAYARRRAFVAGIMATAAALFVAVLPLVNQWRGPTEVQVAQAQQFPELPPGFTIHDFPLPFLEYLPLLFGEHSDEDVYAGLAKDTGRGLARMVLYVPGVGGQRGLIDVAADDADELIDEPAWAVQFSEGLRPVTESVAETFNLLMKALPVTELASR